MKKTVSKESWTWPGLRTLIPRGFFLLFTAFIMALPCMALPAKLGDLDEDGLPTILDVAKLTAHFRGTHPLSPQAALFADMNQDGALNEADQEALANEILQLTPPRDLPLSTVRETSPARGEANVAVTRETILHFSHPLSPFTTIDTTRFHADFAGRKILSSVNLAPDRKKVTLFYLEPLPSNARVIVTFDGNGLKDLIGRVIDADGDGQPGGAFTTEFETISISPVPNTGVTGIVYASERATGGGEVPLAGVTITVDGAEESLRTTTGPDGRFTLTPCPSGVFFVHIDGRTSPASNYPTGNYYPSVGKKWFAQPGRTNNPAGDIDDTPNGGGTGVIYLPCICAGTLNTVSQTQETVITFPPSVIAANPALVGTEIRVPANSLFADDGTRGGKIGIAPVAPDRLPSPLPPGLNPPIVFTVQSDGATNFDQPVPVCLPNLPDTVTGVKFSPGAKSALFSFNHDLGEWEMIGSMTVSEDGKCVATDAGHGIRQPGWHLSQPCCLITIPKRKCPVIEAPFLFLKDSVMDALSCGVSLFKKLKQFKQIYEKLVHLNSLINVIVKGVEELDPNGDGLMARCELMRYYIAAANASKDSISQVLEGEQIGTILDAIVDCYSSIIDSANRLCGNDIPNRIPGQCYYEIDALVKVCEGFGLQKIYLLDNQSLSALKALIQGRSDQLSKAVIYRALDQAQRYIDQLCPPPARLAQRDLIPLEIRTEVLNSLKKLRIDTRVKQSAADEAIASVNKMLEIGNELTGLFDVLSDSIPSQRQSYYYSLEINGFIFRGEASGDEDLTISIAPNSGFSFSAFDPISGRFDSFNFISTEAGTSIHLPNVFFDMESMADHDDTDADGLSDQAERVLGTDPFSADSDNDGISDLQETKFGTLVSGANPSGPAAVSIVAEVASDVSAGSGILAAACGSEGTAFLATKGITAPVLRTLVPTLSLSSAVSMGANAALVAEADGGFRCVSLDDQLNVNFMAQVAVAGRAVAAVAAGWIGYGGTSEGTVLELDLFSGSVLRQLETGAGEIEDLAVQGDWLFARKPDRLLAVFLNSTEMSVAGHLVLTTGRTSSAGRLRICVGEARVFCTKGDGVHIVNTGNLPFLSLAGTVNGPGDDWRHFVSNGNVALLAGKVQTSGNPFSRLPTPASLFTIPTPSDTTAFAQSFNMPGYARAVALNRGIGYVACDNGQLAVVNYLDFDRNRQPPAITLTSNVNLVTATPEVTEGSTMRLSASVTDDMQVGNVEFHVDGVLTFDDGSYPFEYRLFAPRRSATKTSFKVNARALDTGGNATWSTEYTINLLPDQVPPTVRSFLPSQGTMSRTVTNVYVRFRELMDAATLSAPGLSLISAGTDGTFDTADDVPVPYLLVYQDSGSLARLALDASLAPGSYRVRAAPPVADATGNAMAALAESRFRVYSLTDTDNDGIPDDWEPLLGTNPRVGDSNGNGIADGLEDSDNDGTPDGVEILELGQDPRVLDANSNGTPDGLEDSDSDGLLDGQEAVAGTSIFNSDTDGDGLDDGTEIGARMNPLVSNSSPALTTMSGPVAVLNAIPEITPVIPTPAQSGPTTFRNQ